MVPPPDISFAHKTPPRQLPNELHNYILLYVKWSNDRPTMLACALVCHAWFRLCKDNLFRNIFLKEPTAVKRVVQCLSTPSSLLHDARSIFVEHRQGQPSWGHNVLFGLAGKLPQIQEIIFESSSSVEGVLERGDLDSSASSKSTMMFSSNPSMPKLLPGLFAGFHNLSTLRLDMYCFQSFADLLKLVWSIPKLHTLGCHRLSWKHTPSVLPGKYHRRHGCQLRRITVTRCPSVWLTLHFLTAPSGVTSRMITRNSVADHSRGVSSFQKDDVTEDFPGLDSVEAQIACEIGECYGLGSSTKNPDLHIKCKRSKDSGTCAYIS